MICIMYDACQFNLVNKIKNLIYKLKIEDTID
jgi:hypothetical protein